MNRVERVRALAISVALILLVFTPLMRETPRDDFPLSNYPMFSKPRDYRDTKIRHVVAFDAHNNGRPVTPRLVGTEEVMQAVQTVNIAVRRGAAPDLCESVAERVAQAGAEWADVVRIEVRLDRYDAIAYFEGDTRSRRGKTYAECPVEGRG